MYLLAIAIASFKNLTIHILCCIHIHIPIEVSLS